MADGTETVASGGVLLYRDVDEQMRPRPVINWSTLRVRLELEFQLTEHQLLGYDCVNDVDLLKS